MNDDVFGAALVHYELVKLASRETEVHDDPRRSSRSMLRDALLVGTGTAVGAGLGYGATALLKKRYGGVFKALSPEKRLRYLTPAATATGAILPLVHVLRQRAEARADHAQQRASRDGRS